MRSLHSAVICANLLLIIIVHVKLLSPLCRLNVSNLLTAAVKWCLSQSAEPQLQLSFTWADISSWCRTFQGHTISLERAEIVQLITIALNTVWWPCEPTRTKDFTWHFDSIDNYIFHVQQPAENSLHLGCRDVLSFPAESVSCAVLEVHVSVLIHDQHITWWEEYYTVSRRGTPWMNSIHVCVSLTREIGSVSLLEDTLSNLLAGCWLVDITVKPPKGVVLDDPADQLAGLAWRVEERKNPWMFSPRLCGIPTQSGPFELHQGVSERTEHICRSAVTYKHHPTPQQTKFHKTFLVFLSKTAFVAFSAEDSISVIQVAGSSKTWNLFEKLLLTCFYETKW